VTEYWIWNNGVGAWRDRPGTGFTRALHEAGRFHGDPVDNFLEVNQLLDDTDYPLEVAIAVNNTFLSREAQRILAEYEQTGDRRVIDDAYFKTEAQAIVSSPEFQESWGQMLRGEGREIDFGNKSTD
jgi:hypothetical protein